MPDERFSRILAAHKLALGDRDPATVGIVALLPAIIKAVPGTTPLELAEAFRWRAEQNVAEADQLERYGNAKFGNAGKKTTQGDGTIPFRRKPDQPPDAA